MTHDGTGPGRGVPWWRRYGARPFLIIRYWSRSEPVGRIREGRTVAVIRRIDT